MPSTYIPRIAASAQYPDERLTAAVLRSPRLLSAFGDDLTELFEAHRLATEAANTARAIPVPAADLASEAVADLLDGKALDVTDLAERIGAAEVERARRDAAVTLIVKLPNTIKDRIVRHVAENIDDTYAVLSEQLDSILDRAADAAADLGSVNTADEAIASGKADAWHTLIGLAAEHRALRADHLILLRAEDNSGYAHGSPKIARAFYATLDKVLPDYPRSRDGVRDLSGRVHMPEFDPLDTESVRSLLFVARNREALQPHVVSADDAADIFASRPIAFGAVQFGREPSRMEIEHGGEENMVRRQTARGRTIPRPEYPGPFDEGYGDH